MKNFKSTLLAALTLLTAATLQSCLGEDDGNSNYNNYLSKTTAVGIQMQMAGHYKGQLIYNNAETAKKDTVEIEAYSSGDSILHITQIPVKVITNFAAGYKDLIPLIEERESPTINLDLGFITTMFLPTNKEGAYSMMAISSRKYSAINYHGAKDAVLYFQTNAPEAYECLWGQILKDDKHDAFLCRLYTLGLYDPNDNSYYQTPIAAGYTTNSSNSKYCYFDIYLTHD